MDQSIRRRRDGERGAETYADLYALELDLARSEWQGEFGSVFPFIEDGRQIHESVMRKHGRAENRNY